LSELPHEEERSSEIRVYVFSSEYLRVHFSAVGLQDTEILKIPIRLLLMKPLHWTGQNEGIEKFQMQERTVHQYPNVIGISIWLGFSYSDRLPSCSGSTLLKLIISPN